MKRVLTVLIAISVAATAIYFGIRMVRSWNKTTVQQAVQHEQERWMVDVEKLKTEVNDLRDELYNETPQEDQARKVSEILDTPEGIAPQTAPNTPGCKGAEKRLLAFFEYLAQKHPSAQLPMPRFQKALKALAANQPEIAEKDLDTLALFRNIAHFYRTMGANDIIVFRRWLDIEPDAMEAFMPDFYRVIVEGSCNKVIPPEVTLDVASHYSTFLLNTLAGQSYLLRRNSRYRILAMYYAVRILDQANQKGTNLYGVDIKPQIEKLQREIVLYKGLARQKEYLTTLEKLAESYRH